MRSYRLAASRVPDSRAVLRAHYTMDVAGIIAALWVWSVVFALGGRLDALLASLAS